MQVDGNACRLMNEESEYKFFLKDPLKAWYNLYFKNISANGLVGFRGAMSCTTGTETVGFQERTKGMVWILLYRVIKRRYTCRESLWIERIQLSNSWEYHLICEDHRNFLRSSTFCFAKVLVYFYICVRRSKLYSGRKTFPFKKV